MKKFLFLPLALSMANLGAMESQIPQAEWRVEDFSPNYNADLAREILSHFEDEIKDAKKIWNPGCKNGAVTKVLQKFTPHAEIWATEHPSAHTLLDAADEERMLRGDVSLRFAGADYPVSGTSYDLIFSLQHLHWIKDQEAMLKSMYEALPAHGLALIVMNRIDKPDNPIARWQAAIPQVFDYVPDGVEVNNDLIGMYALQEIEMIPLLEQVGFKCISVHAYNHKYCMTSEEEFYELTRAPFMSRPLVRCVQDPAKRQEFFLEMVSKSPQLNEIREKGKTEFSVPLMIIKVRKNI